MAGEVLPSEDRAGAPLGRNGPKGGRALAFDIRYFGDPVLKTRAREVTEFDASLKRLTRGMLETLRADEGRLAIAANRYESARRLSTIGIDPGHYSAVSRWASLRGGDHRKPVRLLPSGGPSMKYSSGSMGNITRTSRPG
jgi:Polypeptide deformylase